jgi:hypothetical protein
MGFNPSASRARQSAPVEQDQSWKAVGFLNLSLPTGNGKTRKLAGIALKVGDKNEADLAAWLSDEKTREERIKKLVSALIVDYRSAEPAEGSGFKLD